MSRLVRARTCIVLTLVVASAAMAAESAAAPPTSRVIIPRGQRVQIAFANDLSGFATAFGASFSKAVRMAIGLHPTIRGFRIKLNTYDATCGDTAADVAAANAIVGNEQNVGVIGQICSTGFDAALPVYEGAGLVTISGSASRPDLATRGFSVFNRLTVADDAGFDTWYASVGALPVNLAWGLSYDDFFGASPTQFADLYYDAATLLIRAVRGASHIDRNGSLVIDRGALAAAVRSTRRFEGVTCTVTLEPQTGNRVNDPAALARCAEQDDG
jgi:ABC-type branched-subunit amino acid transport system substrate-binding protein